MAGVKKIFVSHSENKETNTPVVQIENGRKVMRIVLPSTAEDVNHIIRCKKEYIKSVKSSKRENLLFGGNQNSLVND